jgi:hypothetical protein
VIASLEPISGPVDWLAANQRLLTLEFKRLGLLIEAARRDRPSEPGSEVGEELAAAHLEMAGTAAIDRLASALSLSPFERDLLLVCAGIELDASLAATCAAATGGPWLTFGLALAALREAHWSAINPSQPLRHWRLVEVDRSRPLTQAPIAIDERILNAIVGIDELDARLSPAIAPVARQALIAETHRRSARQLAVRWAAAADGVVVLGGDDRDGQLDVAWLAARHLGRELFAIDADLVSRLTTEGLAILWAREALISGRALYVAAHGADVQLPPGIGPAVVGTPGMTRVAPTATRTRVARPDAAERVTLWDDALPRTSTARRWVDDLAQVPLSAAAIASAASALGGDSAADRRDWLDLARRLRPASPLEELAERIEPAAGWSDLIVPEDVLDQLRAVAAQFRGREKVYDSWGFAAQSSRGLGVTALFTGDSGTGKTMAAEVLAADLGIELYRVELSAVVSKYIGETEKNLERVFVAAQNANALLLFDESDALFGKRSEVRDSHDRYANVETAYLLQRMESYRGLAILTTNARPALDRAFTRRLRFIINFPFPDADVRARLWRRAFPAGAPTSRLDFARLARLNLAGGSIRTIALNASFAAAAAGSRIGMAHVMHAAALESAKRERAIGLVDDRRPS